jgi:acyl carrier protein
MEELIPFIQQEIQTLAFKKVGPDDSLLRSKVLDSISLVDLIVAIEEKIGKRFPQHMMKEENFETINTMIATIGRI